MHSEGVLGVDDLDLTKAQSERFADWSEAALDAHVPAFLQGAAVDGEHLEGGGDVPDVTERDAGEVTAPADGGATPTED